MASFSDFSQFVTGTMDEWWIAIFCAINTCWLWLFWIVDLVLAGDPNECHASAYF
ncbi:hypothetical protein [Shewanella psychrophila]|uniref:hypothetical protein n=1 Tax=Shewanella psychrophila TaxID=225848 RepID=UPI0015CF8CD1|nr:hypothetical protein [Shewanella psychrophila]